MEMEILYKLKSFVSGLCMMGVGGYWWTGSQGLVRVVDREKGMMVCGC